MTEAHDTVIIRTAQLPDAEAIAHVRVAAWRAAYRGLMPDAYLDRVDLEDAEAEHLRDRLRSVGDRTHASVAELGGQIVGYCAYGDAGDDDAEPARGAVYALYVHPDVWRHGIGRQLLVYATHHLKTQGFGEATLFVVEGNTRARRFYEQAGWKTDGYRGIYQWPGFSLSILRYRTTCY